MDKLCRIMATALLAASLACGRSEPPADPERSSEGQPVLAPETTPPRGREGSSRGQIEQSAKSVWRSPLAGDWYPGDPGELRREIEGFFKQVEGEPETEVIGLILPHAGYMFSGKTAACGLKTLGRQYRRIVLIGPSHGEYLTGVLAVPDFSHYETPLGEIAIDLESVDKISRDPMVVVYSFPHYEEHSIHIHLPLLQYAQPGAKVVPIVVGSLSLKEIYEAASVLGRIVDNETLVIASSDFVHYGPRYGYVPFTEDVPSRLQELNDRAAKFITRRDVEGFLEYRRDTGATICGFIPIAVLMAMLPETAQAKVAGADNSASVLGDYTNSVSYLSLVFTGTWMERPQVKIDFELTGDDKKLLLNLARKALVYYLKEGKQPDASDLDVTIDPRSSLNQRRASFVTLKKRRILRGCIGELTPRRPLYRSVIGNVISAAVHDPRFSPVKLEECKDLTIDISVLTLPEPVDSPEKIQIGKHGVILTKGENSAVFLPQVAPEQGWGLEETLSHLAMKAGIARDGWKTDTRFEVFHAIVFGEKSPNTPE